MNNTDIGQHWLNDDESLNLIIEKADIKPESTILEIGPGTGLLTEKLLNAGCSVIAVELDNNLVEPLLSKFEGKNLEVINEDILSFDFNQIDTAYSVVANIPYYLTSKLIRDLLEANNRPQAITMTIQKEVAERIAAKPGKMSVLAISAQFYADVSLGEVIEADKFVPPPDVDSQIIRLDIRDKPKIDVDTDKFFKLVKFGFGEKRKKLVNSLAGGLHKNKQEISEVIKGLGFDENIRAQELSFEQWDELYNSLEQYL